MANPRPYVGKRKKGMLLFQKKCQHPIPWNPLMEPLVLVGVEGPCFVFWLGLTFQKIEVKTRPYVFFFRNKCPKSKPIFKDLGGSLRSKQIWFWIEGWNLVHRMGKGSDFGEGWPQGLFFKPIMKKPRNVWSGEVRAGSPTTHPWNCWLKKPTIFWKYQLSIIKIKVYCHPKARTSFLCCGWFPVNFDVLKLYIYI